MTHPGMESLLAHIDGELSRAEGNAVSDHLTRCTACTTAVVELRATSGAFAGALAALDASEPASWSALHDTPHGAPDVAEEVVVDVHPLRPRRAAPRASRVALRRAAAILLLTAAAGSAAVMGGRIILSQRAAVPEPRGSTPEPATVAAVSVRPVGGRVSITLDGAHTGSRVFVSFTATADVTVAVQGTAPHVTASDGRVAVQLAGATAEVRVTLPQRLRHADITADGALLITVRDGRASPAAVVQEGIPIGPGAQIDE
jgi:anti-sigma factor RsiW